MLSMLLFMLAQQAAPAVSAATIPEPTIAEAPPLEPADGWDGDGGAADPAIAERRRLNAEQSARAAAQQAAEATKQAEHAAALRAYAAAEAEFARQQAEYAAARAAYEQRQREIADWRACYVEKRKDRCPPGAGR
jgi:hypothetical protein